MHFELWPQFSDFARFLCAFALKYHCLLITTFTFCGPEIEIERTTRKPLQVCTNLYIKPRNFDFISLK